MKSRIGLAITLGFVGLLGLAFILADTSGGGFVMQGDKVASIGGRSVTSEVLSRTATSTVDRLRQQNPGATMKTFVASDGLSKLLDEMIDGAAIAEFGSNHGIVAGKRLVDSELLKIPSFRGTDGNFDDNSYRSTLARVGMTDARFREQVGDSLIGRQLGAAAELGSKAPQDMVSRYVALLTESREGAIATIPSASFAPIGDPSAQELASFYNSRRASYTRPERRVVRYATFDDSVIKQVPPPTEAQIAERYKSEAEKYAATDSRKLTQLIVPSEAGGKVIVGELAKGTTLDAAARSKGLSAAPIASVERGPFRLQSSAAVADAVFGAKPGAVVGPIKGSLGWYVVRVDGITSKAGKTLDQARSEIVPALSTDNKRRALADFSAKIEEGFDSGGSLSEAVKELGIETKQSPPITADGKIYGSPDQSAPADMARIVQASFLMESENQPQLAEVEPGKTFIVYDVATIQTSAPAPIEEIRAQVIAEYKLQKGSVAAKAAAEQVLAAVRKGTDIQAALAALGRPMPPVDRVARSRLELRAMRPAVPPPVSLMFTMAKGSAKLLAGPRNNGWYVVTVSSITPGKIDPKGPEVAGAAAEFGKLVGNEYTQQLVRAARDEVGVTKNQSFIDALKRQLLGTN